jgi:NADH:ubiquinone oxidoreductase subunit 6 (subunit J)
VVVVVGLVLILIVIALGMLSISSKEVKSCGMAKRSKQS